MDDHPEGEEELPEQRPPWLVPVVDGVGDQHGGEGVELPELLVIGRLGRDGEVCVYEARTFSRPWMTAKR